MNEKHGPVMDRIVTPTSVRCRAVFLLISECCDCRRHAYSCSKGSQYELDKVHATPLVKLGLARVPCMVEF